MKKPDDHIMVIFGASGDLAYRKLVPALFDLHNQDLLPARFGVLGVGRTVMSTESFRAKMEEAIRRYAGTRSVSDERLESFLAVLHYISFDTKNPAEYAKFERELTSLDRRLETRNRFLYYLATPPSMYQLVPMCLAQRNLNDESAGFKRLVVEKPFGYDSQSARELNSALLRYFREDQIFRIDHYLGKETVQNLLVTRFSNGIFEPLWNRNFVHHVEITSAEDIGVEGRGGYYEGSGALRDMVQNHLMLLVALAAMEPPVVVDADSIRNEMVKVFQSLRPIAEDEVERCVVRGQYTASEHGNLAMKGYREEDGVNPESRTETFVAMRFFIDNWRWAGVPFYVRTGKRLPTKVTELVIHFHATPHRLFAEQTSAFEAHNQLVIRIQPDEGLMLKFGMKMPGAGFKVKDVNMDFHYSDLGDTYLPSAYERLLLDCMLGDATLYSRGDAVEAAWNFVDPILRAWEHRPDLPVYGYPAGTWGPEMSESLFDGPHAWRYPCGNLIDDADYCEL